MLDRSRSQFSRFAHSPAIVTKSRFLKMVCIVSVFCAAMAIASPAQTLTTLYNFCSQTNCTDGALPHAGLVQGTDGDFYGTTSQGGPRDGTVFKVAASGALTTLHAFAGADGANPMAELVQGNDGNFYGTTFNGGANNDPSCVFGGFVGCGTVFKVTPGGSFTTIYNFCSQQYCLDGALPSSVLIQGTDGNLYGTSGGTSTGGTFFKITPAGALTTLYIFCSQPNCTDGEFPGTLIQGSDGNFYGTTYAGGTSNNCTLEGSIGCGTVFKITPQGMLTTLYSFDNVHGCYPEAGLVEGTDGNFYGTTDGGGMANGSCGYPIPAGGTVFKITPAGTLTTLYSFCSKTNCTDGEEPYGELVQATDGNFYGTTNGGGNSPGRGTIFKITSNGAFTSLYLFCSLANCADGILPYGRVIQAADGNIYGTTYEGGTPGGGTVFRLSVGLNPTPWQLVPVTPCRLVDTRQTGHPIHAGTWQDFIVPQLGNCNISTTAAAYSLNTTVVPQGSLGYLTIWPAGRNFPAVSTMNSLDGRVKADAAIVAAGASAAVNVYATNTTDVILDINGYFAPPSSQSLQFYPLTPCRVVDTRDATKPQGLGPPYMHTGQTRDFPVLSSPCLQGIEPKAYSFNYTVVPRPAGQTLGYLTTWAKGQSMPTTSTLNNPTATIVANAAIVQAGTGGDIEVYTSNKTDLIVDVNGYFAAPGQGGLSFYPVDPCRVLDTRTIGDGQPFTGKLDPPVNVAGSACAPPSTAQAYVFNATVVPSGSLGYLTLWPDVQNQPVVSTLNATDGMVTSNMAIVPTGPTDPGYINAYANGLTQLILDISGYFAP
jgi:uncharacterized repeat protein (TIGR03803 family)